MTHGPADAEGVLAHAGAVGEIRRLTLFIPDLVGSTALSTQAEPETFRLVVRRYREQVVRIVSGYGGHIGSTKGGLLARRHAGGGGSPDPTARPAPQARASLGISLEIGGKFDPIGG